MATVGLKEARTMTTEELAHKQNIRLDMQKKVDSYLEKHKELKDLEREVKKLKKEIEPYMDGKGIDELRSTGGGIVRLTPSNRPIITSRYSSFDVGIIEPFLKTKKAKKQCIINVVDADVLKLLVATGEVDEAVLESKITNPSTTFNAIY